MTQRLSEHLTRGPGIATNLLAGRLRSLNKYEAFSRLGLLFTSKYDHADRMKAPVSAYISGIGGHRRQVIGALIGGPQVPNPPGRRTQDSRWDLV